MKMEEIEQSTQIFSDTVISKFIEEMMAKAFGAEELLFDERLTEELRAGFASLLVHPLRAILSLDVGEIKCMENGRAVTVEDLAPFKEFFAKALDIIIEESLVDMNSVDSAKITRAAMKSFNQRFPINGGNDEIH